MVEGEAAQEGEVVRHIAQADRTGDFAKGDFEAPVETVLAPPPKGAYRMQDARGLEREETDHVPGTVRFHQGSRFS